MTNKMDEKITARAHDPVCHRDIEMKSAAGASKHDGKSFYFCSTGCKKTFDGDPNGVLKAEAEFNHAH